MLVEARKAGLKINHDKALTVLGQAKPVPDVLGLPDYSELNQKAEIHHSLHGAWWILEFLPHRYPI
jgi:hypothetical protein